MHLEMKVRKGSKNYLDQLFVKGQNPPRLTNIPWLIVGTFLRSSQSDISHGHGKQSTILSDQKLK